jgi:hypothetical protein
MEPGQEQGGFAFFDARALCRTCHRHGVRILPSGEPARQCRRCWRQLNHSQARARRRDKATVLAALGNCCACPGLACWHAGPCPATHPDVLTVDHLDGTGHLIRRRRRDGTERARQTTAQNWYLYLQELRAGSTRLRLLCHNCHHFTTTAQRRSAREASLR